MCRSKPFSVLKNFKVNSQKNSVRYPRYSCGHAIQFAGVPAVTPDSEAYLWKRTVVPRVDHVLSKLYPLDVLNFCRLFVRSLLVVLVIFWVLALPPFFTPLTKNENNNNTQPALSRVSDCTNRARHSTYLFVFAGRLRLRHLVKVQPLLGDPFV